MLTDFLSVHQSRAEGDTHLVHLTTSYMEAYGLFFFFGACRNLQQFSLK